jgi:hypothetical protein
MSTSATASRHPDTNVLTNPTVILDAENTVQPDALLRRLPEHGGLTRVTDDGYLAGPPELIVEVASSSASIDLRDKRRAYCRNGVREYLVWLVAEARLEWFCLEEDEYRPLPPAYGLGDGAKQPENRQDLPVAALHQFWQDGAATNESEKQFPFTRAASSTSRRAKNQIQLMQAPSRDSIEGMTRPPAASPR